MTLDPQNVRDAADLYVEEYGVKRAIGILAQRLPSSSEQEKNAALEAIGHIKRTYRTGDDLADVEFAQ